MTHGPPHADTLNCPVAACPRMRPRRHLVCRVHWRELPAGLRHAVNDEYVPWRGPGQTRAYYEARERALAYLDGREFDVERVDRLLLPDHEGDAA